MGPCQAPNLSGESVLGVWQYNEHTDPRRCTVCALSNREKMGRTGFFRVIGPGQTGLVGSSRVNTGQPGLSGSRPGRRWGGHPERAQPRSGHPTPYRQPGFFQCSLNPAHPGQPDQPGSTRKTPVRPIFFTVAKAVAQVGLTRVDGSSIEVVSVHASHKHTTARMDLKYVFSPRTITRCGPAQPAPGEAQAASALERSP